MSDIIKLKILEASVYWREPLANEVIRLYAKDLSELPEDKVIAAFDLCKQNPKQKRVPLPSEIREMVRPGITDLDTARLVASSIIGAISRWGFYQSDRAKATIGEVGWEVVTRLGGWGAVCEQLTYDNLGTMQAQMRDLAGSVISASISGELDTPPALPRSRIESNKEMKTLSDILFQIKERRVDESTK